MAIVRRVGKEVKIRKIKDDTLDRSIHARASEFNLEQIEKGGYEHFHAKRNLMSNLDAITDTYRGRL